MSPRLPRRPMLLGLGGLVLGVPPTGRAAGAAVPPLHTSLPLRLPRDHGAHPAWRTEWWYLTGWLGRGAQPLDDPAPWGFQLTFFRRRGPAPADHPSRFAARQILSAHAALTPPGGPGLRHAEALARSGFGAAEAAEDDTRVHLRDWRLLRVAAPGRPVEGPGHHYLAEWSAGGMRARLRCESTQPVLFQGERGWSRKGPDPEQASLYLSEPQLQVHGELQVDGRRHTLSGRAWLDHEWSEALLHPEAVGWDWAGINLHDGGALTVFRLRRADGSTLWAGGSHRPAGTTEARAFAPGELRFHPGRLWRSPASGARYPVTWTIESPAGRHTLRARLDAQELDGRASTGAVYWEGLSDVFEAGGRPVGRGYLEMTGYAAALKL
ncbi:carotenoid 1,2-hydratase [Aquariibacter lacus]|nr:carotenoid 1,2-hydratase [Piscinibacter lacus]